MRILVLYSDNAKTKFVEGVVNTIRSLITRDVELVKAPANVTLHDIDEDEVDIVIPDNSYDIALCLGLPGDLLLYVPSILRQYNVKAMIVPIEDPRWIRPGLQRQVISESLENNIRPSFPKPFCSFQDKSSPLLSRVSEHIGKPKFRVKVSEDGVITDVDVLRTSPCGASYCIAKKLIGLHINEAPRTAALIHSYYCTASQVIDPLIRDSLLHKSCYITMKALDEAIKHAIW